MGPEDARAAALRTFGIEVAGCGSCRDERRLQLIDNLKKDLAFAVRIFKKAPAFRGGVRGHARSRNRRGNGDLYRVTAHSQAAAL